MGLLLRLQASQLQTQTQTCRQLRKGEKDTVNKQHGDSKSPKCIFKEEAKQKGGGGEGSALVFFKPVIKPTAETGQRNADAGQRELKIYWVAFFNKHKKPS